MMNSSIPGIDAFQSLVETYIRIDPNGFIVNSFNNQLSQITVGTNQSLVFEPSLYSYDLDTSSIASNASFKFYCTVVDNGIEQQYPKIFINMFTSLADFKLQEYQNEPCFSNTSS